jgi:alpha-methylacyl-CoA racemase
MVRNLIDSADGLIETFRPGVLERFELAPDDLIKSNPKLVVGRMTGWGQSGPISQTAGHDINYIAISGALHAFGRAGEKPTPPVNTVGNFGGGAMMLVFAMTAALLRAEKTGMGEVIDCSMAEGSALLMSTVWAFQETYGWEMERGQNMLDSGAPFYDTYETLDGKYIAIGALEQEFFQILMKKLGLNDDLSLSDHLNKKHWPRLALVFTEIFQTKTQDEWCQILEGLNACFSPVLSIRQANKHPQNAARNTFITVEGVEQPAPSPRYKNAPLERPKRPKAL